VEIEKEGQKILITGTDDPFDFFTEPAILCLETTGYPFKIAMVHTPELAKTASDNGYALYLCGHTHGGQICLHPDRPLISHQFEGKQYNSGIWHLAHMTGYTSRGAGVSGIPIRFNCPAEVTLFTLQRKTH
jgi:predicted MPP superfamily phosphohydrolase